GSFQSQQSPRHRILLSPLSRGRPRNTRPLERRPTTPPCGESRQCKNVGGQFRKLLRSGLGQKDPPCIGQPCELRSRETRLKPRSGSCGRDALLQHGREFEMLPWFSVPARPKRSLPVRCRFLSTASAWS